MTEKKTIFVDGMRVKKPSQNAPEYIKANFGVNIGDFLNWANQHSKHGWVNFILKESKGGNLYCELDTWEKPADPSMGEVERPLETPKPDTKTSVGLNGEQFDSAEDPF